MCNTLSQSLLGTGRGKHLNDKKSSAFGPGQVNRMSQAASSGAGSKPSSRYEKTFIGEKNVKSFHGELDGASSGLHDEDVVREEIFTAVVDRDTIDPENQLPLWVRVFSD